MESRSRANYSAKWNRGRATISTALPKDPNQPPWRTTEFSDRVDKHQKRRGLDGKDLGKSVGRSKGVASRLRKEQGSLRATIGACKTFQMAPPDGLLDPAQQRLLRALERLVEKLEERYGPGERAVVDSAVEALVSMVEAEVKLKVGEPDSADRPLGETA